MTLRRPLTVLAVILAAGLIALAQANAPKLVVILVVDQMRADYVDRFQGDWTGGLKRMLSHGARFTNARYPYLSTYTCAGHATIATGAFPRQHGIFQNTWYDRDRRALVRCTEDSRVDAVTYGKERPGDDSGAPLLLPTLADVMRTERGSRVVTLSIKARSAIMLAGHGGDAVTWLSDSLDSWQTSTAFATRPVPQVKAFLSANPIEADYGRTWSRLLPADRYAGPDDSEGEAPPKGWTRTFPHVLKGNRDDTKPGDDFYTQWERSPFADAYVGRMAAALVKSMGLGRRETTDVLGLSFSTPDLVGHAFGPRSQEVQDLYAHLDRTIGVLLDDLDALVGAEHYVVVLSADHGVSDIPEQAQRSRHEGGRIDSRVMSDLLERRAQAALGPGKYVALVNGSEVYLLREAYDRLARLPAAMDAVVKAAADHPGIARVFRREELQSAESVDPLLRAAALSYVPRRGGDLILVAKPGGIFNSTGIGTTHGTGSPEDQRVPLLFLGPGIKPGVYPAPVTPADIAPTLAALCRVDLPRAEGHALRIALTTR